MRKVHTFGVGLIGAVVAVACGGSSSSNPPGENGNDGGVTTDGAVVGTLDAGVSTTDGSSSQDAATACVIDADLTTIAPTDAALDDSGDSVGLCLGCVKTTCTSDLATCNADCTCNTEFACFAECISGVGNSLISCVGVCFPGGLSAIQSNPVVLCAAQSCGTPCGVSGLLGGGGGKDAGNGASDSGPATDASTDSAAD